jgi:hypothetical protein
MPVFLGTNTLAYLTAIVSDEDKKVFLTFELDRYDVAILKLSRPGFNTIKLFFSFIAPLRLK